MKKRLPVLLQAQDPGLRRGEGVHPCDNACTFFIRICLVEGLSDQLIRDQSRLPNHLKGQNSRLIKLFHNDLGMLRHFFQTLVPVEILGTCAKPKFVVLYCFH